MTTKQQNPCDQCDWRKGQSVTPASLRMHKIRKHSGRGWNTGGNFRRKQQSREERLAVRRAYQMKLRNRYYAEGRNSKGEKMPPGWKPNPRIRTTSKADYPSSQPEYRRRYARNHYLKKKRERAAGIYSAATAMVPMTAPAERDPLGDAAKAVLLAAKVLRGTLAALKMP